MREKTIALFTISKISKKIEKANQRQMPQAAVVILRSKQAVDHRCQKRLPPCRMASKSPINSFFQGSSTFAVVTSPIIPSSIPTRCSRTLPSGTASPWLTVVNVFQLALYPVPLPSQASGAHEFGCLPQQTSLGDLPLAILNPLTWGSLCWLPVTFGIRRVEYAPSPLCRS